MVNNRIRLAQVFENQIPDFVNDDFPLFKSFLKQYQESLEYPGAPQNILSNIDKYVNIDEILLVPETTTLTNDVSDDDEVIRVTSTKGFPYAYGIIRIEDEIITYKSKTPTSFEGCVRGFSGITEFGRELVFSNTLSSNYFGGSEVENLSSLFLKTLLSKLKKQISPGFDGRELSEDLNSRLFYKQIHDFYKSKGSDESFRILFQALYNSPVTVIRPSDNVFEASASSNRKIANAVLFPISSTEIDYTELISNRTLYQRQTNSFNEEEPITGYASITNVEKIERNGNSYYIVSLDSDYDKDIIASSGSIVGNINVTATTLVTENYEEKIPGSDIWPSTLHVDSTIGFDNATTLDVHYENGDIEEISCGDRSVNEFYDVFFNLNIERGQLISSKRYAYVTLQDGTNAYFRVTNVLSDIIPSDSSYFSKEDPIKFNSLGLNEKDQKYNNWVFNTTPQYNLTGIDLSNLNQKQYLITLEGDFDFIIGDRFFLNSNTGDSYNIQIQSRNNNNEYIISSDKIIVDYNSTTKKFFVERKLNKGKLKFFPESNDYVSDVQNVYRPKNLSDDLFVTSSSIPNYFNEDLTTNDRRITFSVSLPEDQDNKQIKIGFDATPSIPEKVHSFYTGDSIIYDEPEFDDFGFPNTNRLSIPNGRYFVTVVDNKTIKLSTSLNRVYTKEYITIEGNVTDNTFYYADFSNIEKIISVDDPFRLKSKRLVKRIIPPINGKDNVKTKSGKIGILKNGVEILNYKSNNNIFYGEIENVYVLSGGSSYDIINPPTLIINDSDNGGIGATGNFVIKGSIDSINITNGGFNYIDKPTIKLSGGNGSECLINPILESYTHEVKFDSSSNFNVDLTNNKITTTSNHYFYPGERVLYDSIERNEIGGLKTKSIYYIGIGVSGNTSFTLHNNQSDAENLVNEIDFTSFGSGEHKIIASQKKKKISSLNVISSSSDFTYKKISYNPETSVNPIDFYTNTITIPGHGFDSGELIVYDSEITPISGLSSSSQYYVTKIDNDSFRLSDVGVGQTTSDFYFKNKTYKDLSTFGVGKQYFSYPPIRLEITPSTKSLYSVEPTTDIIARGEIQQVFLENGGVGYGCTNIFNYERQPDISAESGKFASVKPFIINGKIEDVIIQNSGEGYVSTPSIKIYTDGNGFGAELIPVINNGRLTDVIVKNSGLNYNDSTEIEIITAGSGAKFQAKIKKWTENIVERNFNSNQIYDDDGFLLQDPTNDLNNNNEYGLLQYTHLYAPRNLRRSIYTKKVVNGRTQFFPDLILDSRGNEEESKFHSPIIGWAYDGNPIYGPYGFSNSDGTGGIKRMESGYRRRTLSNRPSLIDYPLGFFTNDYEWFSTGDLDIHNGRFCITPEYPNGVYAYFATIGNNDASYKNYKLPAFPYFVGDTFKSKPIEFNFDNKINQSNFTNSENPDKNIEKYDLLRNVTPYNLVNPYGKYNYIYNPSDYRDFISYIKEIRSGSLSKINIFSGGENYKVGDKITFDNVEKLSTGQNPLAKVVSVGGTEVSSVSIATSSITDIELISDKNNVFLSDITGICSFPHNLYSGPVKISNNDTNKEYNASIEISRKDLILNSGVGSTGQTGIITYFNVYGLNPTSKITPNDVFQVIYNEYTEQIKVLNVDIQNSRLRVEREIGGTIGTSYDAGTRFYENPRKFKILNLELNDFKDIGVTKINKQFYFNPKESVGVGIGTTISITNPGAGSTQLFIGESKIYLDNNKLKINDKLYYEYDLNPIQVQSFGRNFYLEKDTAYYAFPFLGNFIGISSRPVGIGTSGEVVGLGSVTELLVFNDFGKGDNHSFKTSYDNVVKTSLLSNEVIVTTKENHGLVDNDEISFICKPGSEKLASVLYNQANNKFAIGSISISASDINTKNNSISIPNHSLKTGQKVIFESVTPPTGLVIDEVYFVLVIDSNNIKLSLDGKNSVNISSQSSGRLLVINPSLTLEKNKTYVFDLSDSSLSYLKNNVRYSAFDFKFFYDKDLKHEFNSSLESSTISVQKEGRVGVDANAKVKLICDDSFPDKLFYNLEPVKDENVPFEYSKISLDKNFENSISFINCSISGIHQVKLTNGNKFRYKVLDKPESSSYSTSSDILSYSSISTSVIGPINEIEFISYGSRLTRLPTINQIISDNGNNAILFPRSVEIGKVKDTSIPDIGFDFPSDTTLRPNAFTPSSFKIDPLTSIESIDVTFVGKNYTILPDLILIDGYTNKIVTDVVLDFVDDEDFKVNIIKNTKKLYDVDPILLPINNSNGFKISNITYDSFTQDAEVTLDVVGFSTLSDWPFTVGSKFMIEGVVTQDPDNDEGFNTSDYNYEKLFTVKTADPNIGGQLPSFTFNMTDFVSNNNPGVFDILYTSARVIPESYFPKFKVYRTPNKFFKDEVITNGTIEDIVVSWESKNEILKVFTSTPELYEIGDLIVGKTSNSSGTLTEIIGITTLIYEIDSFNSNESKIFDKKGFLNEESQRIHDSDYYQYFSYSLKTNVGFSTWNDPVSSLNHPSGMKKFSEMEVISVSDPDSEMSGIQTGTGFLGISDITSIYDLNCVSDIDLATENNILNQSSDEIRFNSLALLNYFESIGNRVLIVDDISDEFSSNPRPTPFISVDSFNLNTYRSKKYVIFTSNKKFPGERQMILVNIIHNNIYGFITQYGLVETSDIHGYFDLGVFDGNGLLLFYPIEAQFSDFNISGYSFASGYNISGISTQFVGDIASIGVQTSLVPQGTTSPYKIVGIDSSYTSSKVIVTIESTDETYYQYDEFNIVHDGVDIYETEFSTLNTSNLFDESVGLGIGTYQFGFNGNQVEMSIVPFIGISTDYRVSSTIVSISDTSRVSTGTSTYNSAFTTVGYGSTSVGAATTTTEIISLDNKYKGFNIYASVEDISNGIVEFSEIVLTHDETNTYITEFGRVVSDETYDDTGIGTFSAILDSGDTKILFEPLPNRDVEVRILINALNLVDTGISTRGLTYIDGEFATLFGEYTGTQNDIKRSFELRHQGDLIFERSFDASLLGTTVSISENVLNLSNHFFVSGELVKYSYDSGDTPIGIATTTISGIGLTDKLPEDVYVIKVNNSKIQFADSAENALKFNPISLTISSTGIGTNHKITSTNKDTKGLFTIDNIVQSPVQKIGITTNLLDDVKLTDTLINTVGITSLFSDDIIQINDEIMYIETVGIGTQEKIRVRRPWLGTELGIHSAGDTVTKLSGNYKIVGSTINFASPPYGKVPVTPDLNVFGYPFVDPSDRDYTGITTNSYFHGRTFMRSGIENGTDETYQDNYIFDDISTKFTGIRSEFDLTVDGSDITGISTDNAILLVKDIFQQPKRTGINSIVGNYELTEVGGKTKVIFEPTTLTPGEDVNSSNLPTGGVIVNIGSTIGLGYQPLVAAGGTAIVSGFGSITSISIGNSGSGYRPGIQTNINVFAETPTNVSIIGYATAFDGHITGVAITNPGTAYTSTNPPRIRFDAPLNYTNIPLIYSNNSVQGIGTKASLDIFVSRDTTIGDFKFNNNGYAYGQGEILTVAIGGSTGIPTDTSKVFDEFQVTINETHTDEFKSWSIGQLQQLDNFDDRFDGVRRVFPISYQGERISIRARPGSNIDVAASIFVFINDILQIPNESYTFKGGSLVIFSEPIPKEYTSRVIFYRGTRDVDVEEVDVIAPIEEGDIVKLMSDIPNQTEEFRTVEDILSSDIITTNPYTGFGRLNDETIERPVMACKQVYDKFINGEIIGKDRKLYEPLIYPNTNLIQSVGIDTTIAWVESVKTFFDNKNENINSAKLGKIEIISQEDLETGSGEVVVSTSGTIQSISITNPGTGYTFIPEISISSPEGGGTTAIATCVITNGQITLIDITNPGSGYTTTETPNLLIESPKTITESIEKVEYDGDFGSIVSVANTVVGMASTAINLGFFIEEDSFLRNSGVNQSGFTTSGIQTGYYFATSETNIGSGITSLYNDGSIIGYTSSYFNNVFQVYDFTKETQNIPGIGSTDIVVVTTLVSTPITLSDSLLTFDSDTISFDSTDNTFDNDGNDTSGYFGNFSWGRITWDETRSRRLPKEFFAYYQNGYSGLTTSPYVKRTLSLEDNLYTQYS